MKFEEYSTTWREYLEERAGVYQFGYWYRDFMPKYIGRVQWTAKKYNFYKRFYAYDREAHNDFIKDRINENRKGLWFRVLSIEDPAWTESRMLMEDTDEDGNFKTFVWNDKPSYIAERDGRGRERTDQRRQHAKMY